jgi:hypothetical protein
VGEMKNAYNILVGKLEGKRLLDRPRRRWKDNIIMDVRDIVWEVAEVKSVLRCPQYVFIAW